jgi:hypothetical protein
MSWTRRRARGGRGRMSPRGCLLTVLLVVLALLILSWLFGGFRLGHKPSGAPAVRSIHVSSSAAGLAGTSMACSRSAASGTMSSARSCVEASTT